MFLFHLKIHFRRCVRCAARRKYMMHGICFEFSRPKWTRFTQFTVAGVAISIHNYFRITHFDRQTVHAPETRAHQCAFSHRHSAMIQHCNRECDFPHHFIVVRRYYGDHYSLLNYKLLIRGWFSLFPGSPISIFVFFSFSVRFNIISTSFPFYFGSVHFISGMRYGKSKYINLSICKCNRSSAATAHST